jgi:hypothetical protein
MKKLLIFLFIIFLSENLYLYSATFYVATDGNDSNPGTIGQPWAKWQKGFNALRAGDTLYIRGGTYTSLLGAYSGNYYGVRAARTRGTSVNHITVSAYGNEVPILDCSGLKSGAGVHYGLAMDNCTYWDIIGLRIAGVREYESDGKYPFTGSGWETADCTHMTFTLCNVYGCMNGFTLGGSNDYIYYINCDSYLNYDYYDKGGLCNGFSGNVSVGGHVFYNGCRSWSNSDDGYDNMAGGGYITYTNCWAWRNGYDCPIIGDGDGFKLGYSDKGYEAGVQRTLYNCISANNKLMGFDESMDIPTSMDMVVYNCIAYNNSSDFGFRFYQPSGTGVTTLRNNIAYLNKYNYQGRARNITDHNTWDAGAPIVTNADFQSVNIAGMDGPRQRDGSLPDLKFLHLASGSALIDAGVDVGLSFTGKAPDLGAYETQK